MFGISVKKDKRKEQHKNSEITGLKLKSATIFEVPQSQKKHEIFYSFSTASEDLKTIRIQGCLD